jgi:CTP-dependent riboflavin kinase
MTERAPAGPDFPVVLEGRVQAGLGDASRWLARFNAAYRRKLGMDVFPGSLNVALQQRFDWFAPAVQRHVVWFGREEYGGERDILLLPCRLGNLDGQRAFLWSTTRAAQDRDDPWVVEIVAPVGLRATYGLADGDVVRIELPGEPGPLDATSSESPAD